MCNPDCQKRKQEETLKKKYLDSQTNLITAPNQIVDAEKNYVTFAKGELAYNEQRQQELTNQAQTIADEFSSNFNAEGKQVKTQIDTYNSLLTNYNNVNDLYLQYKNENKMLFTRLKASTNDVLTNERKTYYEDQNIDNLKGYYYYVFLVFYYIFVIAFGILSVTYSSQTKWYSRAALLVFFVVLPYFSTWLLSVFIYFCYTIYGLLPTNVYLAGNIGLHSPRVASPAPPS